MRTINKSLAILIIMKIRFNKIKICQNTKNTLTWQKAYSTSINSKMNEVVFQLP